MRTYKTRNNRNHKLENADVHGITTPDGAENSPVILVITSSSLVNSTIKAYLTDHGYRIAGPYSSHDGAAAFVRRFTPNLVIFDGLNNVSEISLLKEVMTQELPEIPLIILGNNNVQVNLKSVSHLKLPINHQKLGNMIRDLIPFIINSSVEQLIKFVNQVFIKLIQLAPDNYKRMIEDNVNKTIFEFCFRNSDFVKQSGESNSILITKQSKIMVNDIIAQLSYLIENMIKEIDRSSSSTWARAIVVDAIESMLIKIPHIIPPIWEFAERVGVNIREFQQSLSRMIPKLDESEKAIFVAFFSHDDDGPEILMHVTNDVDISVGLNHSLAAQVMTVVGQGTSYHEGVFGPIPIPTANNICAVVWSKVMDSDIKDNRMDGQSLCVVAIGFYSSLLTHLPKGDQLKIIFNGLNGLSHVDDISDMHLELIMDTFLTSLI